MITYRWRRRDQELMFSWTVSSHFSILRVNLWLPWYRTDHNDNIALMNTMCDMSQFVVVVSVSDQLLLPSMVTTCNMN